jgi:hypothetical protein
LTHAPASGWLKKAMSRRDRGAVNEPPTPTVATTIEPIERADFLCVPLPMLLQPWRVDGGTCARLRPTCGGTQQLFDRKSGAGTDRNLLYSRLEIRFRSQFCYVDA